MTNGVGIFTALISDNAQQVQAIEMLGIDLKDPAIELLGFREKTGTVKGHPLTEYRVKFFRRRICQTTPGIRL